MRRRRWKDRKTGYRSQEGDPNPNPITIVGPSFRTQPRSLLSSKTPIPPNMSRFRFQFIPYATYIVFKTRRDIIYICDQLSGSVKMQSKHRKPRAKSMWYNVVHTIKSKSNPIGSKTNRSAKPLHLSVENPGRETITPSESNKRLIHSGGQ